MTIILKNILAIYQRELQSYFASPLAYLIAGVFWLLGGFLLTAVLLGPQGIIAQAAMADQSIQMGLPAPPAFDVAYEFNKAYIGLLGSLSMFVLPMLSMGLYADERKQGTLELLATSPITNWAVALGKLLAVVSFYIAMILPLMICQAVALGAADPPAGSGVFWLSHLGLVLLSASILALGMFISSLTESTVLAAIMTFALILLLWLVDAIAQGLPGVLGQALGYLSLLRHFSDFTEGIFDTSSLVLFLSFIGLGLYLTAQSVETLRFQRS
ncbi:ABC transporter permease [Nodosilinea sp. P-1105]|uniref:ABC transporter permease n=1 Tax=Nodosilinea sp. P-1105 TaxID=2546229 RepID=UPI00146C208F|nr:ABC transporter permease [Nodosilinea sp. P-1105]NMF86491.1 ABC transporter permease [Nodosilinea sp. P-1105]